MFFDTNGVNYIRSKWAVDPETKKTASPKREVLFPVHADGIAPVSGIAFSGAPRYRNQGVDYYGKGLSYSLSSKDQISGVQSTYKSHDSDYVLYESTLDVTSEGENIIYYFSVDNVGNTEDTKISSFVLDLTPPVSNYTLSDVYGDNILGPTFNIGLESSDNLSGVKGTYYTIDECRSACMALQSISRVYRMVPTPCDFTRMTMWKMRELQSMFYLIKSIQKHSWLSL